MVTAAEPRSDDARLARLWAGCPVTNTITPGLCLVGGSPGSGRIMIPRHYGFDGEGDGPAVAAVAPGGDNSAADLRLRNP